MTIKPIFAILPLMLTAGSVLANESAEGYYGSTKYLQIEQRAKDMDTSSRPGVGQFVGGKEKQHLGGAAIALGYQYGNGWRTEGEYTFRQKTEYTSGSSTFANSDNHLQTNVERLMLNVYRDYALGHDFSVFATAGVGISKIKAGGWQGVPSREYDSTSQSNFTYAIGGGVSYAPLERLNVDLGYRYVDMGKIESGYNTFANARGLKDEQMKARLVSNEFTLGVRYLF
ncbi:outer membrane protein [Serratia sp. AKBS12]|uniref:outer membrane protein n=1 Tax=Serratia sp. AKBS12 TaxID=2974597 RepID=UPI0021668252|nr:outer membrane beta-barrel protein [Serratia sp. AKBS12]MCS3406141.1 outer membrane beta-barrel protein [Serratia sp. AKBS12]HEI8867941.1 porin family protein [Serratia odorifera]